MKRTPLEVKKEALNRMRTLMLMPVVRQGFQKDNIVYYSERQNAIFSAVLYYLHNENKYMELKKKFEEENDCMVYHAILTHTAFGDCLDFLYVSNDDANWEQDKADLAEGYPYVYSNNLTDDTCSEFGCIGVAPAMGGVKRTA